MFDSEKTFSVYDHYNFKFQFKCVTCGLVVSISGLSPRRPGFDSPQGSDTLMLQYSLSKGVSVAATLHGQFSATVENDTVVTGGLSLF